MASPLALMKKGSSSLRIDLGTGALDWPGRAPAPQPQPYHPRSRWKVLAEAALRIGAAATTYWLLSDNER